MNSRWVVGEWFVTGDFFVPENVEAMGNPLGRVAADRRWVDALVRIRSGLGRLRRRRGDRDRGRALEAARIACAAARFGGCGGAADGRVHAGTSLPHPVRFAAGYRRGRVGCRGHRRPAASTSADHWRAAASSDGAAGHTARSRSAARPRIAA